MRRAISVFLASLLFISCTLFSEPGETSTVVVSLPDANGRTTFTKDEIASYETKLLADSGNAAAETKNHSGGLVVFDEISEGSYRITVSAYSSAKRLVAYGQSETFQVKAGENTSVSVTMTLLEDSPSAEVENRVTLKEGNSWYDSTSAGKNFSAITKVTFQQEPYTGDAQAQWEAGAVTGEITAYLVNGTEVIVSGNGSKFKANANSAQMFYGTNLASIEGLDLIDTSEVVSMGSMFYDTKITALDLSGFDTSNVMYMQGMFKNCTALTSLNLSSFNTSNVTTMVGMFQGCSSLASIGLSSFNTSNVTTMVSMFSDCTALTSLTLTSFNTSGVTNMTTMFYGCTQLVTIYVNPSSFSVDSVTDGGSLMFYNCPALVGGSGTTHSNSNAEIEYARVDSLPDSPGYFTAP